MTAAAQLCHRAAFTSRLRYEEQNKHLGVKVLAHSMAKAVMQFWRSVELLLDNGDPSIYCTSGLAESGKIDADETSRNERRNMDKVLVIPWTHTLTVKNYLFLDILCCLLLRSIKG